MAVNIGIVVIVVSVMLVILVAIIISLLTLLKLSLYFTQLLKSRISSLICLHYNLLNTTTIFIYNFLQ